MTRPTFVPTPTPPAPGAPTPTCWRCKTQPGVVYDGTTHECIDCAGQTARRSRQMFADIDAAVREGLPLWPKVMDRVEFVRECVKMHREQGGRRYAC